MTATLSARRLVTASELLALTAVLLLASLSLRIWGLTREPAWLDEVYTVQLSEGSWTQILEINAADVHPPIYYLGLRQWRQAFGSELATLRGYSVAWSLVGLVFTLLLAADVGLSRNGILFAGLLTTVNPLGIFFAQEARMYAQATALGIASSWVLWRWLSKRTHRYPPGLHLSWLVIYAALAALLIQTLYLTVFLLLAQGLFVLAHLLRRRDREGAVAYLGAATATVLLVLPWFAFMRSHGPHRLGRLDWMLAPSPAAFFRPFYRGLFLGRIGPQEDAQIPLMALSGLVMVAVLLLLVLSLVRRVPGSFALAYMAWMTCLPILLALLASYLFRPVYHPIRFPVLVLPTFLLLTALTLERIPRSAIRLSFASLTLLLMTAATILQVAAITKHGMRQFADLYRDLGPPDHLVLLPPANTITASYELGRGIENANQEQILASLASGRATEIWIGVERDYLEIADPRLRQVYEWLLSLGVPEPLPSVDRMQIWKITAKNEEAGAEPER